MSVSLLKARRGETPILKYFLLAKFRNCSDIAQALQFVNTKSYRTARAVPLRIALSLSLVTGRLAPFRYELLYRLAYLGAK